MTVSSLAAIGDIKTSFANCVHMNASPAHAYGRQYSSYVPKNQRTNEANIKLQNDSADFFS